MVNNSKTLFTPEAVFLNKKGKIDSLTVKKTEKPKITPAEVLIRVTAV